MQSRRAWHAPVSPGLTSIFTFPPTAITSPTRPSDMSKSFELVDARMMPPAASGGMESRAQH